MPRHAIYWVPAADHPLWAAGCRWLGRDPTATRASTNAAGTNATGTIAPGTISADTIAADTRDEARSNAVDAGAPPAWARAAWRYGFHATLKAPLTLRAGTREADFLQDVRELAATLPDFEMPALQVDWLAGFLALRPVPQADAAALQALQRLADACLRDLDAWRSPEPAAEKARRRAALGDDARAIELLQRWGYPHVLERWRFHLTLSDAAPTAAPALAQRARQHFEAALQQPARAAALAVFVEPAPGQPFTLLARCPLAGPA